MRLTSEPSDEPEYSPAPAPPASPGFMVTGRSRASKGSAPFFEVRATGEVSPSHPARTAQGSVSPFGGVGMSGYGREMGFEAMHDYTEPRSVWVNVDAKIPPFYKR